ncbi:MAG: silent information regulator protein Sir2 [Phycisphaerae bacterium]|nr:silent information regulator protein Sir2 [Phycisphaerae bacterium]
MNRDFSMFLSLVGTIVSVAAAQPPRMGGSGGLRPPTDNERGLRQLTPEEIPPNLNYYAIDPLYDPNAVLGWSPTRIEEKLNRGMLALLVDPGHVYLGWRLLKDDPQDVTFNVYRSTAGESPTKLNDRPIAATTDFVDDKAPTDRPNAWFVRAIVDGVEREASESAELAANPAPQQYRSIALKEDIRGIATVGIADLDGDGVYDFVVKHPGQGKDPGRAGPNRGSYKFDGYSGRTGAFLWRIDLGWNVDMGIWWTPMVVRDLDGDHRAEVCVRTSSYAATSDEMLPSGKTGFLLDAPEYLAVYDGATGEEIDRVPWIELGKVQDWGDNTGNRASRHMLAVAYLDGKTPAVLAVRGTYGMMKIDAWVLENRKLRKVWRWTNERAPFMYQGQGQHTVKTGDIDADGCDEIINGSLAIDHDGRTLWGTGLGHGDCSYMGDIDPDRPGWEIWYVIEEPHPRNGACLVDARTGQILFGADEPTRDNELSNCMAADIDPTRPGLELAGERFYYSSKGVRLPGQAPPQGLVAWWDADLLREFVGRGNMVKWNEGGFSPIQGARIEGFVVQVADLLGDWREELVTVTLGELRIYSTVIPAGDRRVCLMQDPLYRNDVTHHTMGYSSRLSPMTSRYLGAE